MIPDDILDKIDDAIAQRVGKVKSKTNSLSYYDENILLSEYSVHVDYEPRDIAGIVNKRLGSADYNGDRIIFLLRNMGLSHIPERQRILQTGNEIADIIFECCEGDEGAFVRFKHTMEAHEKEPYKYEPLYIDVAFCPPQ